MITNLTLKKTFGSGKAKLRAFKEFPILFSELNLDPHLLRALDEEGYEVPTPIQAQAIPPVLEGKDLLGLAQTGTGKTAAFALPILQRLSLSGHLREPGSCRCLVLAPTRELAIQVEESFRNYGRHLPLRTTCIFGGVGDAPQKAALHRGVDILVATPGRLLDLMNQRVVSLRRLEVFVLDEADRMLDMGFIHDIRKVIAVLPPQRQNLFFSATMPSEISGLAGSILRHPVRVEVTPVSTPIERIEQCIYFVPKKSKPALLRHLLQDKTIARALVFTRMKHMANRVAEHLQKVGINAAAIHGNKSQTHRQKALGGFKDGSVRVLVATDIAARGIDVDGVTHVFNYDLPDVPETYVHRIGRTARAGASGIAIAFCCSEEQDELRQIERLIKRQLPEVPTPEGFEIEPDGVTPVQVMDDGEMRRNDHGRRGGHGRADRGRDPGRDHQPRVRSANQGQQGNSGNAPRTAQPQRDNNNPADTRVQARGNGPRQERPRTQSNNAQGNNAQGNNVRHDNHDPRDQWFGSANKSQAPQQQNRNRSRGPQRSGQGQSQPEYANRNPSRGGNNANTGGNTAAGEGNLMGRISKGIGKIFGR
jgi:ATP-dependent RNA helicase RhlE